MPVVEFYEASTDFEGRGKKIARHHHAQPIVTLNEGDYKVQVKVEDVNWMVNLSVKAGERKTMEVDVTAER